MIYVHISIFYSLWITFILCTYPNIFKHSASDCHLSCFFFFFFNREYFLCTLGLLAVKILLHFFLSFFPVNIQLYSFLFHFPISFHFTLSISDYIRGWFFYLSIESELSSHMCSFERSNCLEALSVVIHAFNYCPVNSPHSFTLALNT